MTPGTDLDDKAVKDICIAAQSDDSDDISVNSGFTGFILESVATNVFGYEPFQAGSISERVRVILEEHKVRREHKAGRTIARDGTAYEDSGCSLM